MISKKLKLKTGDFNKLYTNLYNGEFLNIKVHYIENTTKPTERVEIKKESNNKIDNRYGVVITKRISKSAVQRNKLKRIIFSIIQDLLKNTTTRNKEDINTISLYIIKVKKFFTLDNKKVIIEDIKYISK